MRTIPKDVIINLLKTDPTSSEMNLLIYLYFLADIDGKIRADFFDFNAAASETCLSEISIHRCLASLKKKNFLKKYIYSSSSKIVNDYRYILSGYKNVDHGFIEISPFLITDFMKISKAGKRLILRLLIAENSKHSLRLSYETLYSWSGVNIKSKAVLMGVLNEIAPFFIHSCHKHMVYFNKQSHQKISSEFNELQKLDKQLRKFNIKISINQKLDLIKTKFKYGLFIFDNALYRYHLSKGIKNICAFILSLSKKIKEHGNVWYTLNFCSDLFN